MLVDKISIKTTNFYTIVATTISKRLQEEGRLKNGQGWVREGFDW
jgi:hypothetical protein